MRGITLSNCERSFILKAASELKRLDGRKLGEFRTLKVHFGQDWGLCFVSLGETKVLTQVTCEIQEPKATHPNEGLVFINVELSSMASPHFEMGRASDLSVHINRLLEKCIKDSRAIDLESLCIVAEEKVWVLRVDVNVINHEGNLEDCASISALAALAHFKRPDVTTDGQEIKVHNVSERDPIPITLHHYPVCVSFSFLNNSENIFSDPTSIEEQVCDANLTFGINAYREICCLHIGGNALIKPKVIVACAMKAADRAKEVVGVIKEALEEDMKARLVKSTIGFVDRFEWNKITAMSEVRLKIQLGKFNLKKSVSNKENVTNKDDDSFEIKKLGENCAELTNSSKLSNKGQALNESNDMNIASPMKSYKNGTENSLRELSGYGEGGSSKWETTMSIPIPVDSDSSSEKEDEISELPVLPKKIENIELSGDSEEEEVVILNPQDINNPQTNSIKKHPVVRVENEDKLGRNSHKKSDQTSIPDKSKRKKKNKRNKIRTQ